MQHINIKELIEKFSAGTCTEEELAILENWYLQWKPDVYDMDSDRLNAVMERIWQTMPITANHKTVKLWPRVLRITGVAAAVAVIVFGVWFFSAQYINGRQIGGRHPEFISGSQSDIEPGSNKATIILANGKTISLSDSKTGVIIGEELRYNDGSAVANLSPSGRDAKGREGNNSGNPLSPQGGSLPEGERRVQTLTAATPRGGTYQVTLPDGTRVWLNADSKISFPSQFSDKERKILLSGEAYFEVAKLVRFSHSVTEGGRPERVPFIVESNGQQVEVLGTHFNINAYQDGAGTKTTLLEGSVRINKNTLLKPGQQSILLNNALKVVFVDATDAIDWKKGLFVFDNESLESIMQKIGRWYDVKINYADASLKKSTFSGTISRFSNISKVLERLERTGIVKFELKDKQLMVKR